MAFIQLLNGLNLYFPEVPRVPLSMAMGAYLAEPPWNQLGIGYISVWPIALGITYLLTTEISFSLWFFFLFIKLQYVIASYLGYQPALLPAIPNWWEKTFTGYQIVGASIGIVGFVLWTARHHLAHILNRAFGRVRATPDEAETGMSYPLAFWGFVAACAALFGFGIAAGVQPLPLIVMGVLFLITAIAMARVVAEAGLLIAESWPPLTVMGQLGGAGPHTWLPPQSVLPLAFMPVSGFLLPSFLQAFRLADVQRINARRLYALIFGVLFVSLSVSVWMRVRLGYETGGHQLNGWSANTAPQVILWNSADFLRGALSVDWKNWLWIALGSLEVGGLYWLRTRWIGFPLHPLGLLVPAGYMMGQMWFTILLGWLCKTGITKFGGHDAYHRAVPLFIGISLGDVASMLFWLAIDGWQGRSGHFLMPS